MSGTKQALSVALAAVLIVGLFAGTVVAAGASGGDGALAAATQGLGITDQDDADDPDAAGVVPSEMNVSYDEALATAREHRARSGGYSLTDVEVAPSGYEFEFVYRDNSTVGEAEIEIDGESGKIVESEQEYEADDDEERLVRIAIVDGTPAPGANVTAELTLDDEQLTDTALRLNGDAVGETDENGTVQLTLANSSESTLAAQVDDVEGELEFEFENERDDEDEREDEEEEEDEDEREDEEEEEDEE